MHVLLSVVDEVFILILWLELLVSLVISADWNEAFSVLLKNYFKNPTFLSLLLSAATATTAD